MPAAEGYFLDTNVVLYALGDDAAKRAVAEKLLAGQPVLSVRVLSEASNVLHRKYGVPRSDVVRELESVRALARSVVAVDGAAIELAWTIWLREGLSWFDCLILATALLAGCSVLYTEDMQHGQIIDGRLTLVNPFL